MIEAHATPYALHLGSTKMYQDLKKNFWRHRMKQDVAAFVQTCLTCQQVKAEHERTKGELQPIQIPQWKWDDISMDFIMGLPWTVNGYDRIWVIVDKFSKSAHFLPIKSLVLWSTWQSCTLDRWSSFTESPDLLSLIRIVNSLLIIGRAYKRCWDQS